MRARIQTTVYVGYDIFFRARLLVLDPEQIAGWIDQLEKEAENIREVSLKLAWAMRGGSVYADIMNMSAVERGMIAKLSKENIELTKKSGLPYF